MTTDEASRYRMPGKPPINPKHRLCMPIRFLVTRDINTLLDDIASEKGTLISDYFRLSLYNQLLRDGYLTEEVRLDATWDPLRRQGLV